MSEVVAELQSSGVLVRVNPFISANFSWCLRSASCPGASSTAYICTGNEKCKCDGWGGLIDLILSLLEAPTYMFIEPNFTLPMLVIGVVFVAITIFIAAFVLHRYVRASIDHRLNWHAWQSRVHCDEERHAAVHDRDARGHYVHLRFGRHVRHWSFWRGM